jgi:uncharacterized protein involved in exopolysaccharide biosynthesis
MIGVVAGGPKTGFIHNETPADLIPSGVKIMNRFPRPHFLELIQGPATSPPAPARWRRWQVFAGVLCIATLAGLAIVYGREPIYRATATVLTVKPKAVDTPSAVADLEHVAIQERLLLGETLLDQVSRRLADEGESALTQPGTLRDMLSVLPVAETNLLELRAEGRQPILLQRIVNRWAESYESMRATEIAAATGRTTDELEDEQTQLGRKIEEARAELQTFRERNDIVSLEREENRSLSGLKGLNDSLNKAREELIRARAKLKSTDDAIAKNETVAPPQQQSDLARLTLAVQRARDRLDDIRSRYTQQYIDRHPSYRDLPAELKTLEHELERTIKQGRITAHDDARQQVETARESVTQLERSLAEQQQSVQVFTQRFKEFSAMEEGLARLETLFADNQQRLAQIQVRNLEKSPPIQIVEWAHPPTLPISPNYSRDLLIALAVALLSALFATWLYDYLSERMQHQNLSYLGMHIDQSGHVQPLAGAAANEPLEHGAVPTGLLSTDDPQPAPVIELPRLPRELTRSEIQALLGATDALTASYCALLLSGVTPAELQLLHPGCLNERTGLLSVPGAAARNLMLVPGAWHRLAPLVEELTMGLPPWSPDELDRRLGAAATSARIDDWRGVTAFAIWHHYVLYLVRQGVELKPLQQRVGALSPSIRRALASFAPANPHDPLTEVDWIHPELSS